MIAQINSWRFGGKCRGYHGNLLLFKRSAAASASYFEINRNKLARHQFKYYDKRLTPPTPHSNHEIIACLRYLSSTFQLIQLAPVDYVVEDDAVAASFLSATHPILRLCSQTIIGSRRRHYSSCHSLRWHPSILPR